MLVKLSFANISAADPEALSMNFDVDVDQYGDHEAYYDVDTFVFTTTSLGDTYSVGYQRLRTAVFEDNYDSDYAVVIVQSTAQPIDNYIRLKVLWFYIEPFFEGATDNQVIYSDIDNSSKYFYSGVGVYSSGFIMEQPTPRDEPDTNYYTVGIEISKDMKIDGSITFEDGELDLFYDHDASQQYFEVEYRYSCTFNDCSYSENLTFNSAAFMVNMTNGYSGQYFDFVNKTYLSSTFINKNYQYGNFSGTSTISSTIWY
jgi:hypothetical protein